MGDGGAQRFTDAGNREFAVTYDEQQRVQSVSATRGPHIYDIVSVGYAPDGKLIGIKFRTGYTLFFDTQPNGTQVIRESQRGNLEICEKIEVPGLTYVTYGTALRRLIALQNERKRAYYLNNR